MSSNGLLRVITAIVMLIVVVGLILFARRYYVLTLVGTLLTLAGWEWLSIVGIKKIIPKVILLFFGCLAVILQAKYIGIDVLLQVMFFFWLATIYMLVAYPRYKSFWQSSLVGLGLGYLLFVSVFAASKYIYDLGNYWFLYALSLIWIADTSAYYCGKNWGKKKLLPQVSPGKTLLGALAAIFSSLVLAWLSSMFIFHGHGQLWSFWLLSGLTALFGIVGDLLESLFKRAHSVKDSGSLLPGHGGVLDRIDGLLAGLPIFALGNIYLF